MKHKRKNNLFENLNQKPKNPDHSIWRGFTELNKDYNVWIVDETKRTKENGERVSLVEILKGEFPHCIVDEIHTHTRIEADNFIAKYL